MIDERPMVDSRESEMIRQSLIQQGWLQKPLPCGDYSFLAHDGLRIGITRKTSEDLLNSIGELFAKQLDEMLDYYDICFFLREGPLQRNPATDYLYTSQGVSQHTYSGIENWLIRFFNKGFNPMITSSPQHTCQRLCELYALYQKPYSLSAKSRKWADDRILALPAGVRGATGQRLLEYFGSLQKLYNASLEDLLAVNGIGSKKAELIFHHGRKEVRHADSAGDSGELQEHPVLRC